MSNTLFFEPVGGQDLCVVKVVRAPVSGKLTLYAAGNVSRFVEIKPAWVAELLNGLTTALTWAVSPEQRVVIGDERGLTLQVFNNVNVGIWSTKSLSEDATIKPLVVIGQYQVQAFIDGVKGILNGALQQRVGVPTFEELLYPEGAVTSYALRYMLNVTRVADVGVLIRVVQFYGRNMQSNSAVYVPVASFLSVMLHGIALSTKPGAVHVGDVSVSSVTDSKTAGQFKLGYHVNAGLTRKLPSDSTGNVRIFGRAAPDFIAFYNRVFAGGTSS